MIYLDHAATTPIDGRVLEAMERCARQVWANPSAAYSAAGAARRELRLARQSVAALVNAGPGEVVFTSGGTEANNQAVAAARGGHAVISAIEHASVLEAARALCSEVTLVPPDADGRVDPEAVARALRPDTRLVSVQLANNETGVIQPAARLGALARRHGALYHCDAVQAAGRIPVDFRGLNADLLTLSGHKLYGPRGTGALVVRTGIRIAPLIHGGGQELGLRSGTENLPAIAGLGVAAALALDSMPSEAAREAALMDAFLEDVRRRVPACRALCPGAERLPGVAALLLPGLPSEIAIARLDTMGIQLSGGAACATGRTSRVYAALLPARDADCVLRVSLGRDNDAAQLKAAAEAIGRLASGG